MSMLYTNLDVRSYAMKHGVMLQDIAKALNIPPSTFSVQYMRMEQSKATKDMLKDIIRRIAEERNGSNEEQEKN